MHSFWWRGYILSLHFGSPHNCQINISNQNKKRNVQGGPKNNLWNTALWLWLWDSHASGTICIGPVIKGSFLIPNINHHKMNQLYFPDKINQWFVLARMIINNPRVCQLQSTTYTKQQLRNITTSQPMGEKKRCLPNFLEEKKTHHSKKIPTNPWNILPGYTKI